MLFLLTAAAFFICGCLKTTESRIIESDIPSTVSGRVMFPGAMSKASVSNALICLVTLESARMETGIPETPFTTLTNQDGTFQLIQVPQGIYQLIIDVNRDGIPDDRMTGLTVKTGQAINLSDWVVFRTNGLTDCWFSISAENQPLITGETAEFILTGHNRSKQEKKVGFRCVFTRTGSEVSSYSSFSTDHYISVLPGETPDNRAGLTWTIPASWKTSSSEPGSFNYVYPILEDSSYCGTTTALSIESRAAAGGNTDEVEYGRDGGLTIGQISDLEMYLSFSGDIFDANGDNFSFTTYGTSLTSDRFSVENSALGLDGNDRIVISDSPEISGGAGALLTVSTWVFLTGGGFQQPVAVKYLDGSWKDWALMVQNNHVTFGTEYSGNNYNTTPLTGATLLAEDTWYHLVLTLNGREVRLYVNGVQDASTTLSFDTPDTNAALEIGRHGYYGEFFNGRIDEFRIYSRVLDIQEILALYENSKP